VVFAVVYLVLVIRRSVWCWPAALVSVGLSLVLFADAKLYMESGLQVFYAAMAVYGWHQWTRGGEAGRGVSITTWSPRVHLLAIAIIVGSSGLATLALTSYTDQAMPFLDSFTTFAAIVTTFMVARKILENWIYWFVIDSVSIYLYLSRDLWVYAGLFVVYLFLIVIGMREWLTEWRDKRQPT
jgi:nicotinamide mononucleotide transporter